MRSLGGTFNARPLPAPGKCVRAQLASEGGPLARWQKASL